MHGTQETKVEQTARLTNLTTGGPVHVDVCDGRIVRIIPLELEDSDGPSWTIRARGGGLSPPPPPPPPRVTGGAPGPHLRPGRPRGGGGH
jgi:hypothetical protein